MSNPSSVLDVAQQGDYLSLIKDDCEKVGSDYHDKYHSNSPFPHIVFENFLPTDVLSRVVNEFPSRLGGRFNDDYSKLKTGYGMDKIESSYIKGIFSMLNSAEFLLFLENLTGIKGLIPDPHFLGGGLHETARGGHLSIHADFNHHKKLNLIRKLNLILFLNEDWKDKYGGDLELWDRDMSKRVKKVSPTIGTAVIFNTDADCYHGHPEPLNCPEGTYRRSMALYYYSSPMGGSVERSHTTIFKPRPGSGDSTRPNSLALKEILRDFVPPIVYRMLKKK